MEGFHEGQKVWVEQPDGSQRPGIFVSDAETPGCLGGPPAAYVVYPDTRSARSSGGRLGAGSPDPDDAARRAVDHA
jgi:hypothetical protein